MNQTVYQIKLVLKGCDDETHIEVFLNADQFQAVEGIARLSQEKSEFQCQPTMLIEEVTELVFTMPELPPIPVTDTKG